MILVLVAAGASALQYTVPLTLVIVGMLALLVVSYTQVIAAHPDGGGAYAVAKGNLGRWPALLGGRLAGRRLRAHGRGQPGRRGGEPRQRVPGARAPSAAVSLVGLVLLTAINMFGITESAKLLMLPAACSS